MSVPRYHLRLLGGSGIEVEHGDSAGLATRRHPLALAAILAVEAGRAVARDKLVALLWPDADTETARKRLRVALHALRQALGPDAIASAGDDLRLDATSLRCDLVEFRRALEAGRPETAVQAYGGPLLDGFHLPDSLEFDQWAEVQRERLARQYRGALEALAERCGAEGEWTAAVEWWRKRAEEEPSSSRVIMRLMEALERAGDRAAALREAERHTHLLREEFDAEPEPEVRALVERMRAAPGIAGTVRQPAATARADPKPTSVPGPVPGPDPRIRPPPTGATDGSVGETPASDDRSGRAVSQRRRRRAVVASVVLLLAAAAIVVVRGPALLRGWLVTAQREPSAGAAAMRRFSINLPDSAPLAFVGSGAIGYGRRALAISPDGRRLVYVAQTNQTTRLYLRDLDELNAFPLPGTEGAYQPFFSPDGESVAFFAGRYLKKTSVQTGQTVTLAAVTDPNVGLWAPDDRILVAENQGRRLTSVPSAAGTPQRIPVLSGVGASPGNIQLLDHEWLLHGDEAAGLAVTSLKSRQRYALTTSGPVAWAAAEASQRIFGSDPHYLEGGYIAYISRDGALMVLPFDRVERRALGPPIAVMAGIRVESFGGAQFSISPDGTIVYAPGGNMRQRHLAWVDHETGAIDTLAFPAATYGSIRLSPDGGRIFTSALPAAGPGELWILDIAGRSRFLVPTPVLEGWGRWFPLAWWPDGESVVYYRYGPGRLPDHFRQSISNPSQRRIIYSGRNLLEPFPDGRRVAIPDGDSLIIAPADAPRIASEVNRNGYNFDFSPDGEWLTYTGTETGKSDVYVTPVDRFFEVRYKISADGGEGGVWSPDGRFIVYRDGERWFRVDVSTEGTFRASPPRLLFEGPYAQVPGWSHDISADGKKQLVLLGPQERTASQLIVVTDWLAHVEQVAVRPRVPSGREAGVTGSRAGMRGMPYQLRLLGGPAIETEQGASDALAARRQSARSRDRSGHRSPPRRHPGQAGCAALAGGGCGQASQG